MFANQEARQDLVLPALGEPHNSGLVDILAGEGLLKRQSGQIQTSNVQEIAWVTSNVSQVSSTSKDRLTSWPRRPEVSLAAHIKGARAAVVELLEGQRRQERTKVYGQALEWIARNRQRYTGQWIAVQGFQLLTTGTNARDVHARVRGLDPPALIVKIEPEDLPFGGW